MSIDYDCNCVLVQSEYVSDGDKGGFCFGEKVCSRSSMNVRRAAVVDDASAPPCRFSTIRRD